MAFLSQRILSPWRIPAIVSYLTILHNHSKATPYFEVPRHKVDISYARSSGPGGQNVNKVNTKVDLRFNIKDADWLPDDVKERLLEMNKSRINKMGEFHVQSDKHRHLERNIEDAIQKVQQCVDEAALPPKERVATKVPEWAIAQQKEEKRRRSSLKQSRSKSNYYDD